MARWSRPVWILELVVYAALMLVFGVLVEPFPGDRALRERSQRLVLFGGFAATYIILAVFLRIKRREGDRTRPAAIEALEALDLSSAESRERFLAQATPYAKAPQDTLGELTSRLVDALRWSRPERRDFVVLMPILDEARERIRIERRMRPLLARLLEAWPGSKTNSLRRDERRGLLVGVIGAPVLIL